MQRIIFLIAFLLGFATPLVTIIASIVAANRARHQQSAIMIRMLVGLSVWLAVSGFAAFLTFVNVYSVAHTDYAYKHGGVNPDDAARVDNFLAAVEAIYAMVCGSMVYYYLRLVKRAGERALGHDAI